MAPLVAVVWYLARLSDGWLVGEERWLKIHAQLLRLFAAYQSLDADRERDRYNRLFIPLHNPLSLSLLLILGPYIRRRVKSLLMTALWSGPDLFFVRLGSD